MYVIIEGPRLHFIKTIWDLDLEVFQKLHGIDKKIMFMNTTEMLSFLV